MLRAGVQPQLDSRQRALFAQVVLAVAHAGLGGYQQRFASFSLDMVAIAVAVFRLTFQYQVQNVDFRIGTRLERRAGRQDFLVEHAQRRVT